MHYFTTGTGHVRFTDAIEQQQALVDLSQATLRGKQARYMMRTACKIKLSTADYAPVGLQVYGTAWLALLWFHVVRPNYVLPGSRERHDKKYRRSREKGAG